MLERTDFIHEDVFDRFVNCFKDCISKNCILGPGTKKGVTCGPLVNNDQVNDAMSNGAKAIIGGKFNKSLSNKFYESTLLINLNKNMKIYSEEIFRPV